MDRPVITSRRQAKQVGYRTGQKDAVSRLSTSNQPPTLHTVHTWGDYAYQGAKALSVPDRWQWVFTSAYERAVIKTVRRLAATS